MTSAKRRKANRRNARKSTGPKTAEGKEQVRLNALKHGLTRRHRRPARRGRRRLPRPALDAWKDDFRPAAPQEDYLIERARTLSWQLDRADRTIAARLAERMRASRSTVDARERRGQADRGQGPVPDAPAVRWACIRTSRSAARSAAAPDPPAIDDPTAPSGCFVASNPPPPAADGCSTAGPSCGGAPERRRRSLAAARAAAGRPPAGQAAVDAVDDPAVQRIYLGCFALDPNGPVVFADRDGIMSNVELRILPPAAGGPSGVGVGAAGPGVGARWSAGPGRRRDRGPGRTGRPARGDGGARGGIGARPAGVRRQPRGPSVAADTAAPPGIIAPDDRPADEGPAPPRSPGPRPETDRKSRRKSRRFPRTAKSYGTNPPPS